MSIQTGQGGNGGRKHTKVWRLQVQLVAEPEPRVVFFPIDSLEEGLLEAMGQLGGAGEPFRYLHIDAIEVLEDAKVWQTIE